jgi:hemerythrin-like metal-binding protein
MNNDMIEWESRYMVGIEQIDDQHRELFKLANDLFLGCQNEDGSSKIFFELTVHKLVSCLKKHIWIEEQLLEYIKYPDRAAHKQQHSVFVKNILEKIDKIEQCQQPRLKQFAYHLRDMLITHITLIDKKYATYIHILNRNLPNLQHFRENAFPIRNLPPSPQADARNAERQFREQSLPTEMFLG